MNKFLKWALIVLASLMLIMFIGWQVLKVQTKKASPEATVTHQINGASVEVFYNRPSKKEREIFGELVPYGVVWRTGANEATTFETDKDLTIDGKTLPAGKYTLWTIPNQDSWEVIFNGKQYGWGVGFGAQASREPEADVLALEVPVESLPTSVEMFTIDFEGNNMTLSWDQTKVSVPIS